MAAPADFFSLGSTVWCKTCYNSEVQGEVLAFDPTSKILILKCSPTNGDPKLNDVNIINLAWVSELKILKEVLPHHEVPQPLNFEMLNRRLHKQVNEKKHKLQAISANVSEEGKSLFLAISKVITEIRWRNSEIVVFNQDVIISPPYQLENIKGNINSKEYGFIKKVVEKFFTDNAVCQNNSQ
ncbi:protein LSM12 homolog B [Aethina tumida]|uniref:protein LSM12 homolog B n=1 Tax=Aethina tumida TaxID=116153 RepID=UPI00096AE1A0|nr:protein LSM12 homolog B [Aethina tumida]